MERHLNAEGKRKVTGTQGGQLCLDDDARRVFLGISLSTHGPIYILNTLLHPGPVPSLPRDNGHAQKSCNVHFDWRKEEEEEGIFYVMKHSRRVIKVDVDFDELRWNTPKPFFLK